MAEKIYLREQNQNNAGASVRNSFPHEVAAFVIFSFYSHQELYFLYKAKITRHNSRMLGPPQTPAAPDLILSS